MSDYLYDKRSRDLYHQSLKSLRCPHTRLVRGLVEKRSIEKEIWLTKHIEHCEQCRAELQLAGEEERLLAGHIPRAVAPSEFLEEIETFTSSELKRIRVGQSKSLLLFKTFGQSIKQVASKRIFWLGLLFFALLIIKIRG